MIKNKKGYSMSGWTEGILLSILLVAVLGIVVAGMNVKYGQNYDIGLGADTTESAYIEYQDTLDREIGGGEVEFSANQGLTLKSSWGIIKSGINIIWNFLTGGWIESIVAYMHLPSVVGVILRILYFISVGFIILTILFKVKP